MTEHVCSRKYVPSTKYTSHFGIVWNRNRWSVFEPSAIAVNTQQHLATTPRTRPADRLFLSSIPPPEIPSMEGARMFATRRRFVEEICISGRSQARGGRRNHIKMAIHIETGTWVQFLKLTICEQQACNFMNVNVSIYLLIIECNLSFFHKTLSSWTRSLFFGYPYQIRSVLDLVTPNSTNT